MPIQYGDWINAKEQQPRKRERVLLSFMYSCCTATYLPTYSTKDYDFEKVFLADDGARYSVDNNNLFWMPLPAPPEDKL